MDELGVGREHHILGLHRCIDDDPPRVLRLHRSGLHRHRQAFLQQGRDPLLAHALTPARHRRAVEWQFMLEELLAAQILEIGVLNPTRAQRLVRQVEGVLEDRQPGHQPRRQGRHARSVGIDRAETLFQHRPVDGLRQPHQFVLHVENLIKAGAEQILFSRLAPLAWLAHPLALRFTAIRAVNHASPGRKTTNWNCKETTHNLLVSCNFETNIARVFYEISTASEFFTADRDHTDRQPIFL